MISRPWLLAGLVLLGLAAVYWMYRPPPQMGVDDGVFRTVDALYTAVRKQDAPRLADCARRLDTARQQGKLPSAAADHLAGIIAQAQAGDRATATRRLHAFMLAQRRTGP